MILYQALILCILLGFLGLLVWNLSVFRTVGKGGAVLREEEYPFVSLLVPARNEELRIAACAGSLKTQDYPRFEVIVLDDHSEDRTAAILEEIGFTTEEGASFRRIHGKPLPEGWTGKAWACQQLGMAARGEYLLFVDADTTHAPGMLRAAVSLAIEERSGLLSAWPLTLAGTWSERLIMPLIHFSLAFSPVGLWEWIQKSAERARRFSPRFLRAFGAANGQFLLFKRECYFAIGGHESVRNHMVEDVALGRQVASRAGEGWRLVNCDGSRYSKVRMYTCFSQLWEGFTKNIRAVFEDSLLAYFLTGIFFNLTQIGPFVWVWFLSGEAQKLVIAQIVTIYLIRLILVLRFQCSWLGAIFHPFAFLLVDAIGLNSWRCTAGKGVTWKGRRYTTVYPS